MLKLKNLNLSFWSGIIGNTLDHYDTALYLFLAPILAPIFFPNHDPVVALILTYGIKSFAIFIRPFGASYFGGLALKYQITNILAVTLSGVAICTFFMGLVPTYNDIGWKAPALLALIRIFQSFFAAGEQNIAALFILDKISNKNKTGAASSYYVCSTMTGIMISSFAATLVIKSSAPEEYWRVPFFLGLITSIIGIYLRIIAMKAGTAINPTLAKASITPPSRTYILSNNKAKLLKIIIMSSFSYMTFAVPFILFNNLVPLMNPAINIGHLMHDNTKLLILDILLLPLLGKLSDFFNHLKWMAVIVFCLIVTLIPIFYLLPNLNLIGIIIVRLWIIILGVGFSAPFYSYIFKLIGGNEKYLVIGFGYSVGVEILGKNITVLCIALFHYFKNPIAPAIYLTFLSILVFYLLIQEILVKKSKDIVA